MFLQSDPHEYKVGLFLNLLDLKQSMAFLLHQSKQSQLHRPMRSLMDVVPYLLDEQPCCHEDSQNQLLSLLNRSRHNCMLHVFHMVI